MGIEIDVKSSTVDKALDLAKDFLGKLISPSIAEYGLLHGDNVRFARIKNQITIVLKAKKYCEEQKISIKTIPLKILAPLLENASLEEDETMQDKWAKMIVNMVDSDTNLQNHIFPYLLSQISLTEFESLRELIDKEHRFYFIRKEFQELKVKDQFSLNNETRELKNKVERIEQEGFDMDIEEYEQANLLRLGLVKLLPPKIYIEEFKTGGPPDEYTEKWHQIDAIYDPYDAGYRMTELGRKFIEVCELEMKKT